MESYQRLSYKMQVLRCLARLLGLYLLHVLSHPQSFAFNLERPCV